MSDTIDVSPLSYLRRTVVGPRRARLVGLLVAVVVVGFGWPSRAEAHSFLIRTSPASGSRLATAPDEIVVDFSEPINGTPQLTLRTAAGRRVDLLFVGAESGGTRVRANLPALQRDAYVVSWQIVASDGHTTEGEFAFAVGTDLPAGASSITGPTSTAPFPWVDAMTQLLLVAGLAFALGGLVSERFIWKPQPSAPTLSRSPATVAVVVAIGGAVVAVVVELRRRHMLVTPGRWVTGLDTRADRFLLAIVGVSCLGLVAVRSVRFRAEAAIPVAIALAFVVWRGHSGDDNRWWATPIGSAHVIGGALWAGALLHLTRSTAGTDDAAAHVAAGARRYSRYAMVVVPATIGFGTIIALTRFDRVSQLWSTGYGQVILVKVALLTVALVIANYTRRNYLPTVGQQPGHLRLATRIELGVVIAVVAASVILASTAPPTSANSFILGPPPVTGATWSADLAGNNLVLVAAVDHQLQVRVLQPGGQPPPKGRATMTGQQPDGGEIEIAARACGPGCEIVNHDWKPGPTTLAITVADNDSYAGGIAHISIEWPPGPDGSQLLMAAVAATKAAPKITLTESVASDSAAPAPAAASSIDIAGSEFVSQEPFANGGDDVHQLATQNGLNVLTFIVPASNIWVEMWIDPQSTRIVKETIVDPGHRIEHTLAYPT